jgi:hypothetical protein
MPNQIKTSPAESLLALFAGSDRAAAILGDLTEMAATRGRLWFVAAYARTLVSFTWRIVLALFVADIGRQMIFDLFHLYIGHTPAAWRNATGSWLDLLNSSGPLLACIMSTLWFVLPFAVIRYGVRDRFVRLTAAVAVGTTLAFLCIPWASLACAAATLVLATAAFTSSTWRKPLEVLLWTGAAGVLTIAAADAFRLGFHPQPGIERTLASYAQILTFQGSLLVAAFVCSRLHRWLLEPAAGNAASA